MRDSKTIRIFSSKEKEKESKAANSYLKIFVKEVETGANGTQEIRNQRKEINKGKVADVK